VAHTTEAWEFSENEFFQVSGTGGTVASTGFAKVKSIIDERYNPARHNIYLFYASDGDNAASDQGAAHAALESIARDAAYSGYLEVSSGLARQLSTETGRLFSAIVDAQHPGGSFVVNDFEDVWKAVRHFFQSEHAALEGPR
jgi:uncharacterized sporulation protein YeaH/YhbH (DUF444 family)